MQGSTAALRAEENSPVALGGYIPTQTRLGARLPSIEEQLKRQTERQQLEVADLAPIQRMLDACAWGEGNLPEGASEYALVARSAQAWENYPSVVLKAHEAIAKHRPFVTDVTSLSRLTRVARTSSCLALFRQTQPYLLKLVPVQLGVRRMGYSADETRERVSNHLSGRNDEFCLDSGTLSDIFATCPEALPPPDTGIVAGGDSIDRDHVPVYMTGADGHFKVIHFTANQAHRSHGQATGFIFRPTLKH